MREKKTSDLSNKQKIYCRPTFIRGRDNFARASLTRKIIAAKQTFPYGFNNNTKFTREN